MEPPQARPAADGFRSSAQSCSSTDAAGSVTALPGLRSAREAAALRGRLGCRAPTCASLRTAPAGSQGCGGVPTCFSYAASIGANPPRPRPPPHRADQGLLSLGHSQQPEPPAGTAEGMEKGRERPRTHRSSDPTQSRATSMAQPDAGQRRSRRLSAAGGAPPCPGPSLPAREPCPGTAPRGAAPARCPRAAATGARLGTLWEGNFLQEATYGLPGKGFNQRVRGMRSTR